MKFTIKYPVITGMIVNKECWEIGNMPIQAAIFSFIKTISDARSIYKTILAGPLSVLLSLSIIYTVKISETLHYGERPSIKNT